MDLQEEDSRKGHLQETEMRKEYVINLIAHVNHGKTTVMDNVLEYLGVLTKSMAGEARLLDSRKDELERGMTMKLSPVSMFVEKVKLTFLDTPGHLEFNSLTESTFIVSDVSLVIVDVIKGVTERMKQLVRKSVENGCRLVLFINKVDLLFKMEISSDEIEYRIDTAIREVNQIAKEPVEWDSGSVIIGSARDNWALSVHSDTSRIIPRKKEGPLSVKKTVRLLQAIHRQGEKELAELGGRIGRKVKKGLKDRIEAKEIISHEFGVFRTLYLSITGIGVPENSIFHRKSSDTPEELVAVICANTVVNGEITAIVRTVEGKCISTGDCLVIMESGVEAQRTVTGIVYFTESHDQAQSGSGLIGVQGIECKKRGIISETQTERVREYLHAMNWPQFTPLFTDIIIPAPESYDQIIERLTRLSRCEPGLFISVKKGRIIVRSDGVLQIDKIRTDLEGLKFITEEQSEIYQETVEGGEGVIYSPEEERHFSVVFRQISSETEGLNKFRKLFGRECYAKYEDDLPSSIKMSLFSLLQNGPFIMEQCNMISVEISITDRPVTGSLVQIYMESHPRILVNHTVIHITVPSVYSKPATTIISKSFGYITSTEIGEDYIVFYVRIPVSRIKFLTNTLRTQTRGEADILPTNELYQMVPDRREYENSLAEKIREDKGLSQKDRID